jgi:uncharacterized membrane protein
MNEDQNNLFYMNRRELKELAKDRLRAPGVRSKLAIAMIIPTIITIIFGVWSYTQPEVSVSATASASEIMQNAVQQASSTVRMTYLQQFLLLYFVTGVSFATLDLVRNRDHEFTAGQTILRCFNGQFFWSVLLVAILTRVSIGIGTILLIVPGILLTYGLRFVYLVLYDAKQNGERTDLFSVLAQSYRLTRGYKFDLFVLDLSFIGWEILVGITAGIANLWVEPYVQMTTSAFYEQLKLRYADAHPADEAA